MNIQMDILNRIGEYWWQYVIHATWQAALVAILVVVTVRMGRRWPSPLRYGLLAVALIKFAVPPMLENPTGIFSHAGPKIEFENAKTSTSDNDELQAPGAGEVVSPPPAGKLVELSMVEPSVTPEYVRPENIRGGNEGDIAIVDTATAAGMVTDPSIPAVETPLDSVEDTPVPVSPPVASAGVGPGLTRGMVHLAASGESLQWKTWLMFGYLAGIAGFIVWAIWQINALRKTVRGAREVKDGPLFERYSAIAEGMSFTRLPRLLVTSERIVPMAVGLLRPAVVIPDVKASYMQKGAFTSVLAHELAHIQRRDAWINWLQIVLTALWWFNPFLWLVNREMRRVREECCDDLVLSRGQSRDDEYCTTLIHAASTLAVHRSIGARLGFADRLHPLGNRIKRIMDKTIRRVPSLPAWGALIIIPMAMLFLPGLGYRGTDEVQVDTPRADGPKAGEIKGAGADPVADTEVKEKIRDWTEKLLSAQTQYQSRSAHLGKDHPDMLRLEEMIQLCQSELHKLLDKASPEEIARERVSQLEKLLAENKELEASLLKTLAEDHPSVKKIQEMVGLYKAQLASAKAELDAIEPVGEPELEKVDVSVGVEGEAGAWMEKLIQAKIDRLRLRARYGRDHPAVEQNEIVLELCMKELERLGNEVDQVALTREFVKQYERLLVDERIKYALARREYSRENPEVRTSKMLLEMYNRELERARRELKDMQAGEDLDAVEAEASKGIEGEVGAWMEKLIQAKTDYLRLRAGYGRDHPAVKQNEIVLELCMKELEGFRDKVDQVALNREFMKRYERLLVDERIRYALARQQYSSEHPEVRKSEMLLEMYSRELEMARDLGRLLEKGSETREKADPDTTESENGVKVHTTRSSMFGPGLSKTVETTRTASTLLGGDSEKAVVIEAGTFGGSLPGGGFAPRLTIATEDKGGESTTVVSPFASRPGLVVETSGMSGMKSGKGLSEIRAGIRPSGGGSLRETVRRSAELDDDLKTVEAGSRPELNDVLLKSVEEGNLAGVKSLIRRGAFIDTRDENGNTPLHLATRFGRGGIAEFLVGEGANINAKNTSEVTPLFYALSGRNEKLAVKMIKLGADTKAVTKAGQTMLHAAAVGKGVEALKLLYENADDKEEALRSLSGTLYTVAAAGDMKMLKTLLSMGVDPNWVAVGGRTALGNAVSYGRTEIVKLLLDAGTSPNAVREGIASPLENAIVTGNLEVVKLLVKAGADLKAKTWNCESALGAAVSLAVSKGPYPRIPDIPGIKKAAREDRVAIVKYLLEQGADPNTTTDGETSLLLIAAYSGDSDMIKLLGDSGATFEVSEEKGISLLYTAARNEFPEVVALLLSAGIDPNSPAPGGAHPLSAALDNSDDNIVHLLLEAGADPEIEVGGGRRPLHRAADDGSLDIAKRLIEAGALVNVQDDRKRTPLYLASEKGHEDVVELLLAAKAETGITDSDGRTPLYIAIENGHDDIVKTLLEHGASPDIKLPGGSPISASPFGFSDGDLRSRPVVISPTIVKAIVMDNPDLAEILIKAGADVKAETYQKATPLHFAASRGYTDIARLLIDKGADVNAAMSTGDAPLHWAAKNKQEEVVKLLIDNGAEVDKGDANGITPLIVAVTAQNSEMVKLLLKKGADINTQDVSGMTALHHAVIGDMFDMVKLLIELGADKSVEAVQSGTPLDIATDHENMAIIELLKKGAED